MKIKKVKDLSYASILKANHYNLKKIDWQNGVGWFEFEDDEKADELINKYINGELVGNIKEFDNAHKTLRQILFSSKR